MKMAHMIRIAMAKQGIKSESELSRRAGWSPQNLHNKMNRDNFSTSELEKIAEALDAKLEIAFVDKETGEKIV